MIAPRSEDLDSRRHEFILNVLLTGFAIVAFLGFITTLVHRFTDSVLHDTASLLLVTIFLIFIIFSFWLSRKGFYKSIAFLLIGLFSFIAFYLVLVWSFELPAAQLLLAFSIVLTGVLFRATTALIIGFLISTIFLFISYVQFKGLINADSTWLNHDLDMADAIGCVAIFIIIGVVTWLANKEIDNSLNRARKSEAALEKERDNLEVKVVERTRQVEETQLKRVMELQRFAEFGRLSAGLLHDLTNPLTVASLNLEELGQTHRSSLIKRAITSLNHIERYVEAARKQLKTEGTLVDFSANTEVRQIVDMLNHRAKESGLDIKVISKGKINIHGDPVKFNQLVANLLINSIEAYDDLPEDYLKKPIKLILDKANKMVRITVQDYGRGLKKDEINRIFEPFYSTKSQDRRNMGIGLSMVKQVVKDDFNGRIKVTSSNSQGTNFTVYLKDTNRVKKNG